MIHNILLITLGTQDWDWALIFSSPASIPPIPCLNIVTLLFMIVHFDSVKAKKRRKVRSGKNFLFHFFSVLFIFNSLYPESWNNWAVNGLIILLSHDKKFSLICKYSQANSTTFTNSSLMLSCTLYLCLINDFGHYHCFKSKNAHTVNTLWETIL